MPAAGSDCAAVAAADLRGDRPSSVIVDPPASTQPLASSSRAGGVSIVVGNGDGAAGAAGSDDERFAALDAEGFLRVGATRDVAGRPVVLVVAKLLKAKSTDNALLARYVEARCAAIAGVPYTLVWIQTGASYTDNCPGLRWLWRVYESAPAMLRDNLAAVHVLHPDFALWTVSMAMCPWLSARLWSKVDWVRRVEFLWEAVLPVDLPAFVTEHDALLEDEPLRDYGIVAHKELLMQQPGAPL